MYPRMFKAITERKLITDLAWDAIIDSSEVGYQKPQEIFLLITVKNILQQLAKEAGKRFFMILKTLRGQAKSLGTYYVSDARDRRYLNVFIDRSNPV